MKGILIVLLGISLTRPGLAQDRTSVDQERKAFVGWLLTAPVSPLRAVVLRPIGAGIRLGPADADIPLEGVEPGVLSERDGRVTLQAAGRTIPIGRGHPVPQGNWRLSVSGPPGRAVVTVYAAEPPATQTPSYFPFLPARVYQVELRPPAAPRTQRLLAPDGVEVDGNDAGTVALRMEGARVVLQVMRLPGDTEDESELEIYFRDETSGRGSYPAGRFVSLIPRGDGRYTLDFNRARNPFCAYNTVYPCPAPWKGNSLPVPVKAGERYPADHPKAPGP